MRSTEGAAATEAGDRPVMLVTLTAPGFTARVANRPISVEDTDTNTTFFYDAGLMDLSEWEDEVDLFSMERAELATAQVSLLLPEDAAVPGDLDALLRFLTASRCEVATIWEGQSWKDRRVRLGDGEVSNLKLGRTGEPIRFVAQARPDDAGAPVGDASRLMNDYPTSALGGYPSLDGREFPVVIGQCYGVPCYKLGDIDPTAGFQRGLGLAGHHFADTTVPTLEEDGSSYAPIGVISMVNTTALDGGDICYLVSTSVADFTAAQGSFTARFSYGGVQSVRGAGAAKNADGVLTWLLVQSGVRVDWRRMQPALDMLREWAVGVYVDREDGALNIIRDRLLPVLPLIEEKGADGLWFRYADVAALTPVATLTEGQQIVGLTSGIEQLSKTSDVRNRLVIRFAYDHAEQDYTRSYVVDSSNHPLCAISENLFGTKSERGIDCNIVQNRDTAARMAHTIMSRKALPRFGIGVILDPDLYWLEEGSVVLVTLTTFAEYNQRRAVVRKLSTRGAPIEALLEFAPAVTK